MLAAYLFWDSLSVLHGASASAFALSLATSVGPSCLHGNPFLMSTYLHIRTAQRGVKERESERLSRRTEWGGGEINNAISTGSLNDATLTAI